MATDHEIAVYRRSLKRKRESEAAMAAAGELLDAELLRRFDRADEAHDRLRRWFCW
jgi:hypothetical protein